MMYANLAAWIVGVRDWLDADHLSDEQVNVFIELAQNRLNRELAAYEMEATLTETSAAGIVGLPPDFNRIRQVSIAGVGTFEASTKGEIINAEADSDDSRRLFAIDAGAISLYPSIGDGAEVIIDYYVMVPPITDTVDNNLFTDKFADMMLWAALIEGSNFIVEDDRAQLFEGKYATALEINNQKSKKVKLGSTPLRRFVRAM
jgi:hypothetical protein